MKSMPYEYETMIVEPEIEKHIARITLNRPEDYNRITEQMKIEFREATELLGKDDNVRVIIYRGAGKHFCVGARSSNILGEMTVEEQREGLVLTNKMQDAVAECPKATIFQLHGLSMAGGAGTAIRGDVVIMASDAKMAFSAINVGLTCTRSLRHVASCCGRIKATELVMTGRTISAQEAFQLNLVNYVVPPDDLEEKVIEEARLIASKRPASIALIKYMNHYGRNMSFTDYETWVTELNAINRTMKEAQEGLRAFQEKRTPPWQVD
jgi:enoyl-CoA hydratase/carnithine racemase